MGLEIRDIATCQSQDVKQVFLEIIAPVDFRGRPDYSIWEVPSTKVVAGWRAVVIDHEV